MAPAPADVVPLPEGAPFGRVVVDTEGCTLCLACVGACPTGALLDHPDRPGLRYQVEVGTDAEVAEWERIYAERLRALTAAIQAATAALR